MKPSAEECYPLIGTEKETMFVVQAQAALRDQPPRIPLPEVEPSVSEGSEPLLSSYYKLRDKILEDMDAGRLESALQVSNQALELAEQIGDEDLIDQAFCNRFCFILALDCSNPPLDRLRSTLMRNRSLSASFSAAYFLAIAYTKRKEYKKALFYAQIARDRARAAGESEWMAKSHNEMGCSRLSESYFEESLVEFEKALELLPDDFSANHTAVLGNLGYAKLMLGDYSEGFRYLFTCLRWCRSHESERMYEAWIRIYLCFGYTELGRWRYAWQHGRIGLELAEESGDQDAIKNALYLLGEVEKSAGDIKAAYDCFERLQKEFYPDSKDLPELMMHFDARKLVNLRA